MFKTPREIRETDFERVSKGYKVEDVDFFLAHLADQIEKLLMEKADSDQKIALLAERVEQYRHEEDALRSALISAERMKESILAEATQQQEILLRDAKQKAERIVSDADSQIKREEVTLAALKQQVSAFKSEILNIYKRHLEIISDLPDDPSEANYEETAEVMSAAGAAGVEYSPAAPVYDAPPAPAPMMDAPPQMQIPETPLEAAPIPPMSQPQAPAPYDPFTPHSSEAPAAAPMPEPIPAQAPPANESVFASFASNPAEASFQPAAPANEDSRFGKLDFGENFSFGRD